MIFTVKKNRDYCSAVRAINAGIGKLDLKKRPQAAAAVY